MFSFSCSGIPKSLKHVLFRAGTTSKAIILNEGISLVLEQVGKKSVTLFFFSGILRYHNMYAYLIHRCFIWLVFLLGLYRGGRSIRIWVVLVDLGHQKSAGRI